jgi:diacylglycerol kinase family enzyme
MAQYLAIVNSRIRESRRKILLDQLRLAGIDFAETKGPGHAIELARNAHSYEGLIAVGGDGTLHEVINGMDLQRQCVGIFPAGTVNGIARYIGLGYSEGLSELMKTSAIQAIDVIDAEYSDKSSTTRRHLFAGFLALGHSASCMRISHAFRFLPFGARIVAGTMLHTLIQQAKRCTVTVDDAELGKKKITSLIINNCIAEVFSSIKKWNLQDGMLEVQAVRRWMPGQMLNNFTPVFRFLPDPAKWLTGIKNVDVSISRPVDMLGDGEIFAGITRLKACVVPGGIRMIVPLNARLSYGMP